MKLYESIIIGKGEIGVQKIKVKKIDFQILSQFTFSFPVKIIKPLILSFIPDIQLQFEI